MFIFEAAENKADDVNKLPDAEQTGCQKLDNTADNLTGIDAVYTAQAEEAEEGEEKGRGAAQRGDVIVAHIVVVMGGMLLYYLASTAGLPLLPQAEMGRMAIRSALLMSLIGRVTLRWPPGSMQTVRQMLPLPT